MTDQAAAGGVQPTGPKQNRSAAGFMRTLEVDTRILGMVVALVVIWIGFDIWSNGLFLSPRNLWNLSVQTSSVAVMATGMVYIIVSRNIDLSVGSLVGVIGMTMALFQAEWLPRELGLGFDQPYTWILAVLLGVGVGAALGSLQGVLVSFVGIPSFIVTLGGLLVWRGLTFGLASGRTIAPMDGTFQLLGGGPRGSVGDTLSWIIAGVVIAAIIFAMFSSRRRRIKYGFPARPVWAELLLGGLAIGVVLMAVNVANSYAWPVRLAEQFAIENSIPIPEGGYIKPTGIANPVLIMLGVGVIMTILATRRRFGRYVWAIGGNPEAAELSGINTRRTILLTFTIMGVLAAISAVISTARLNAAVSGLGVGAELQVIAAAVIGGTSFAGGIGSIPGAILGALVMQSLVNGMQLMAFDSWVVDIAVGVVLVAAVGVDIVLRRR